MAGDLFWLVLLGLLAIEVVVFVYLKPNVVFPLLVAASLGGALVVRPLATVGTVSLFASDLMAIVLAAVLIPLWMQRTARGVPTIGYWALLLALSTLGLARGFSEFGLQRSFNFGRGFALFFLVAFFSLSAIGRTNAWSALVRTWIFFAAIFSGVAVVFFLRHGFGTFASEGSRPLDSLHALVVSQAGFLSLHYFASRRSLLLRWMPAGIFFMVVLLSAQRTVWAVTVATFAVLAIVRGRQSAKQARAAFGVLAVAAVMFLSVGPEGARSTFSTAITEPTQRTGTFEWRLLGWTQLVNAQMQAQPVDIAVGNPSGTGYRRRVRHGIAEENPHDFYITALLTTGAIGLVALILAYGSGINALRRASDSEAAGFALALLVGQLFYFITYPPTPEQALLFGASLSLTVPRRLTPVSRAKFATVDA